MWQHMPGAVKFLIMKEVWKLVTIWRRYQRVYGVSYFMEHGAVINAVINDTLQGTVVTYLRCFGISNNHINNMYCWDWQWKKLKSANMRHSYG